MFQVELKKCAFFYDSCMSVQRITKKIAKNRAVNQRDIGWYELQRDS